MMEAAYVGLGQFAGTLQNHTQADHGVGEVAARLFGQGIAFTALESAMLFVCFGALLLLALSLHMEQRTVSGRMTRRWESPYAFPLEIMHGLQANGAGTMAPHFSPEPPAAERGAYAVYRLAPGLSISDVPLPGASEPAVAEAGMFFFDGTQLPLFAADRNAGSAEEPWQEAA